MDTQLAGVCTAIMEEQGEALLRYLRDLYHAGSMPLKPHRAGSVLMHRLREGFRGHTGRPPIPSLQCAWHPAGGAAAVWAPWRGRLSATHHDRLSLSGWSRPELDGRREGARREAVAARRCRALGLTQNRDGATRLTPTGYLVANVAKEYCNWIDHGRRLPPPRPDDDMIVGKRVLDVGCSYGRWLWAFEETAAQAVGIELQREYIELGEALARREDVPVPRIHQGAAQDLDSWFARESMDTVFSRLVLTHVPIRKTLDKVSRVLRPGGMLWVEVRSFAEGVRQIWSGDRRLRSRMFAAFGALNSLCFMLAGVQISAPFPGRMHARHCPTYPTAHWWQRALADVGLHEFELRDSPGGTIVFTARKS